jgi:hypothetical protein
VTEKGLDFAKRKSLAANLVISDWQNPFMVKSKKPKSRSRHSIGEWYGRAFEDIAPAERLSSAKAEYTADAILGKKCPFQHAANCNKKGGVCSLRRYDQMDKGPVHGTGLIVTTCPNRFLEADVIYKWVGSTLLDTDEPVILSEIGFLDRLKAEDHDLEQVGNEEDKRDFIGRIDNVLVHPSKSPMDWCALEIQAVYFSGKSMRNEFQMLSRWDEIELPFPAAHRRPDWRSSGPKRLLPQLQTKVPTIRTWGKKMAVVVDEAFFESLEGLKTEKHRSNAEIVWFVVGYDKQPDGWKLVKRKAVFTKLDASVETLTGGVPLSRERFEGQLRDKLKLVSPTHPLVGS